MKEQDGRSSGIRGMIDKIRTGERAIDANVATSLEELYFSEKYRFAILSGADRDVPRRLKAIRMITTSENGLASMIISTIQDKCTNTRLRDQMGQILEEIPLKLADPSSYGILESEALDSLKREGLHTAAGLAISADVKTGQEIIEVYYPKSFMKVLPVPPNYQQDLGLLMATFFLRKIPLGSGAMSLVLPTTR